MSVQWAREVIVQAGKCPRYTCRTKFGPIRVEQHSTKCQKDMLSPSGWVFTAHEVGLRDVRLKAETGDDACVEALRIVAKLLRDTADELDPPA